MPKKSKTTNKSKTGTVVVRPKTASERLISVNETKLKCIELDLTEDIGTKVLFRMLDNYHKDGTTYIGKELKLCNRYDAPRKYIVNLWNDRSKKDVVLIRALNESEAEEASLANRRLAAERRARSVAPQWTRDSSSGEEDSSSEDEAPNLVA